MNNKLALLLERMEYLLFELSRVTSEIEQLTAEINGTISED